MKGIRDGQKPAEREVRKTGILRHLKCFLDRSRLGELLVIKGLISPQDLRYALGVQKDTQKPLGQIFLKHAMISKRQLLFILGRQMVLRGVTAFVLTVMSLSGFGNKTARADSVNTPAGISLAMATPQNYAKLATYPGLFGTNEKRSTSLGPFTKWTGMFNRMERDLKKPGMQNLIREWRENLDSFRELPLRDMAAKVNSLMNEKPYILDSRNWGKSDYWETPVEFLQRGGDCEDFAISKYVSLRMLGVPEERLRVAIVHDKVKNIPHAVLAVYTDDGSVYILDNQNKSLVEGSGEGRYRPIFSINRGAWWLHTSPDGTQIASR
ncbi:MAG: transglutaminase-like cysteine peptidase [Alphaproteobacteria bacterium]|nr:transglutaminase-like cysteine peptidase [Alphaproteobacteria bacterium]